MKTTYNYPTPFLTLPPPQWLASCLRTLPMPADAQKQNEQLLNLVLRNRSTLRKLQRAIEDLQPAPPSARKKRPTLDRSPSN